MSKSQSPTEQEWKELYAAAAALHALSPWEWMWDSDVFGVEDPENGGIGYCALMGRLGEHFALAVYEGDAGLAGLWQMRMESPDELGDDPLEMLLLQKCLMVSFEDRAELQKQDLDRIKALGLKFRGRQTWPLFRSYLPGYPPWFLTAPQARFLTIAIQQALEVARRFQRDPNLLPEPNPEGPYLVRAAAKKNGTVEWTDTLQKPGPLVVPGPPLGAFTVSVDRKNLQQLKAALPAPSGALEMDFFPLPAPLKDDDAGDERPFFPYLIMAADSGSGMILGSDISRPGEVAADLVAQFLGIVDGMQRLPAKLVVSRPEAKAALNPIAAALGVKITVSKRLKAIEAARLGLSEFMGAGLF